MASLPPLPTQFKGCGSRRGESNPDVLFNSHSSSCSYSPVAVPVFSPASSMLVVSPVFDLDPQPYAPAPRLWLV